eukprot:TRINITY_DN3061_c0_g1_i2.p1 TRINITY_DN3061_c0_g1~~TRINITY_DN3061_c0_g1_i2.p1  ORF type:complete len:189 (-),score=21.58 TRINITY_DN3061_c0_g1_i2:30-596(-)
MDAHNDNKLLVTMRQRLHCRVYSSEEDKFIYEYMPLNEVLLDRGSSPYLSKIDLYIDNVLTTTIRADGVIAATATGSTAYSMSAGGTMAPPTVPGIFITPICPQSLAMRPLMLPDCILLKFQIPEESREGAFVTFDGRNQMKIECGDYVEIRRSLTPIISVNMYGCHAEWFNSIKTKLGWNVREVNTC